MSKPVWIVDDDAIFRMILSLTIRRVNPGAAIREYDSALPALEALTTIHESELPHCLFLDINLPEMDGWAFLDEITRRDLVAKISDSCIYIVSSSIDPQDEARAKSYAPVRSFVSKPINEELLRGLM